MKILIIKLSALGDVLVSTPFFRLIKQQHPDWEVHHLVMRHCASVTENNPWVEKQIVVDFIPSGNQFNDLKVLSLLWLRLLRERYDLAILFHRNFLFQLLCKFAGISKIIGFNSTKNWFLDHSLTYGTVLNRTIQEHHLLLEGGIQSPVPDRLEFYPDKRLIDFSKIEQLPETFVACNPGGGNLHASAINKQWPIRYFAKLIDQITFPVVVLGYGKIDQQLDKKLSKMTKKKYSSFVGYTNLHETAIILERSRLYVGNDSSLTYLSAAMGTLTLGLFGPTQTSSYNPLGSHQYYLKGTAPCAPCYNPFDGINGSMYTCKNNVCMQNINVPDVIKIINEILDLNIFPKREK